jgi:hypothetical protein
MSSILPIINPFNGSLKDFSHVDKPCKSIVEIMGSDNPSLFYNEVKSFLENDSNVKIWKETFSEDISENLKKYQEYNTDYNIEELVHEIDANGMIIPDGQHLFHGGFLNLTDNEERYLDRVFATSITPEEAFFHAYLGGRAYDNEKIEILIILVKEPKIKSLILFSDGATLSHEYEVLFNSGLLLKVLKKIPTEFTKKVDDCNGKEKDVLIDIIFCTIS